MHVRNYACSWLSVGRKDQAEGLGSRIVLLKSPAVFLGVCSPEQPTLPHCESPTLAVVGAGINLGGKDTDPSPLETPNFQVKQSFILDPGKQMVNSSCSLDNFLIDRSMKQGLAERWAARETSRNGLRATSEVSKDDGEL